MTSPDKYPLQIADAKGVSIHLMSRQELIEVASTDNTWIFVDSQMVGVKELETIELNEDTEIRLSVPMSGCDTCTHLFSVRTLSRDGTERMEQLYGVETFKTKEFRIYVDGKYYNDSENSYKWHTSKAREWRLITRIDRNIASPIQYRWE